MLRYLLDMGHPEIRVRDRDEKKQGMLANTLRSNNVRVNIGDILHRVMGAVPSRLPRRSVEASTLLRVFPLDAAGIHIHGSDHGVNTAVHVSHRSFVSLFTDKIAIPVNTMDMV